MGKVISQIMSKDMIDSKNKANVDLGSLNNRVGVVETTLTEKANQTDLNTSNANIAKKIDSLGKRKNDILNTYHGKVKKWFYPSWWSWTDAPINIFSDGTIFFTNFDVSKYKNVGGKNLYVNPVTGTSSNDGLTPSTPCQSIYKAYTLANDGDTIWLQDGVYKRPADMNGNKIEKNINIISVNTGKARIFYADDHTYTKTPGYNYIYQTARTNVGKVIDIRLLDACNETLDLTKVATLSNCDATQGTWYSDGTNVYIHSFDNAPPDNTNTAVLLLGQGSIYVNCTTKNVNLYLEGFQIYGSSTSPIFFSNSSSFTTPNLYMKNVICRHTYSSDASNANAINVLGAQFAFLQGCEASYSNKDGFNYHSQNGTTPKAIEINCIGRGNGDNTLANNVDVNNGSTIHDGGKIIRINGSYHENMGCNVADVHVGTQSLCLGCVAYNSLATSGDMYNSGFGVQQTDAEMWVEGCVSFGNLYDLTAYSGTKLHVKNSLYNTSQGSGTFDFIS
jgi:hypothetical protein